MHGTTQCTLRSGYVKKEPGSGAKNKKSVLGAAGESAGFTLVELLTVIAVIGILAAIAIPSYIMWLPNVRLNTAVLEIYGVMMKAKGEAAKRNQFCTLTFNQEIDGESNVWVLYEDSDQDLEFDVTETVILSKREWPPGVVLDTTKGWGDGITLRNNDDGNPSVSFRPTSIPINNEGTLTSGGPYLTNSNGRRKQVDITQAGGVRIRDY